MSVDVLVYCANGLRGQAIVAELLHAGLSVRAIVRDADKAAALGRAGAQVISAALEDSAGLARAHEGVGAALLQVPTGHDREDSRRFGSAVIAAIQEAGVQKIIYNPSVQVPRQAEELPSFAATSDIEAELRRTGLAYTVIRPTFLLQNLLLPWVTHSIASSGALVYPIAAGRALSWVACEDVGRLAATIISHDGYGHSIDLGACQAIDGDTLAHHFSLALERPIDYVSLPLDQFEANVDAALGSGAGQRIGAIFRFIQNHPDDLDFVTSTFTPPPFDPAFAPTTVTDWIHQNRNAYTTGRILTAAGRGDGACTQGANGRPAG